MIIVVLPYLTNLTFPTLESDKPDTMIIVAGCNNSRNLETNEIVNKTISIVNTCRQYGVINIYVSSITFCDQFKKKVSDINILLRHRQILYNFTLIKYIITSQTDFI